MIDKIQGFKNACEEGMQQFSLHQLRAYGRSIGVDLPTKKKKGELIADIVAISAGELAPIERSKRGAPVKDERIDPKIEQVIAKQRYVWFAGVEPPVVLTYTQPTTNSLNSLSSLVLNSPKKTTTTEEYFSQKIYAGQLGVVDDVPCLIDKEGDLEKNRLLVSIELIREYGLREGDVITCHAHQKMGIWAAKNILSINGAIPETLRRFIYDEEEITNPHKRIKFLNESVSTAPSKYLDFLIPICYGQRCLISSPPKAGKSLFLRGLAQTLVQRRNEMTVLALLIDQSPELVASYRAFMEKGSLVATTFDEDVDAHIFAAEFLLKRAKRLVDSGYNVILIIDSLSKIAKSYNETNDSIGGKTLPCGLESKAIHYIKKYFGTARCFSKIGSLTILGSVSFGTGDAADDVLYSELSAMANAEIRLSESLSRRRIFPAVDIGLSYSNSIDNLIPRENRKIEKYLRETVIPEMGEEFLREAIMTSENVEEFNQKIKK